ncbi:MAG: ABC transporter permease [Spirochaetaceae bacterium]|nr:ABC transporter permease [Spirochaetaceae bacterium]
MRAYIIRRLLLIIPTLFILSILVFLSVRFIPGDVIDLMVIRMQQFDGQTGHIDREALERYLGLDVPVHVQYGRWLGVLPTPGWITGETFYRGLLQGSLGESLIRGAVRVEEEIGSRLPVTIELGFMAIVIGLIVALPIGIYSAMRQDTAADYVGRSVAIIGLATPNFWLGVMVMIFPAIWWGWSPPMEWIPLTEDPLGNIGVFIIPSLILGTALSAATMRMTRTMVLEVLRQDYIRTAWSKGLKERVVIMRHALKNAFMPILTLVGMQFPILVGGSVIMENIFNLPGLGRLMVMALIERDYPVVSGVNLFFASAVVGINLMIDLIYPYLDPRVRYS